MQCSQHFFRQDRLFAACDVVIRLMPAYSYNIQLNIAVCGYVCCRVVFRNVDDNDDNNNSELLPETTGPAASATATAAIKSGRCGVHALARARASLCVVTSCDCA